MSSPPDIARSGSHRAAWWLWAGLALATALVVALAWQVMRLREDQRWLLDRATRPYVGMYVPALALATLDGRPVVLGQPRGDTQVLFFFTTGCPYCRASLPQLKRIGAALAQASAGRSELIGVALSAPAPAGAYVREHGLDFPVVAHDERRAIALFRARKVPALLVVGGDGRVRYRHVGAIDSKQTLREVLAAVAPRAAPVAAGPGVGSVADRGAAPGADPGAHSTSGQSADSSVAVGAQFLPTPAPGGARSPAAETSHWAAGPRALP